MTEAEVAWSAGLFEGEGSIEISGKNRSRTGVRLHLGMTDLDVVEKFARLAGCGTVREVKAPSMAKPNWKTHWTWSIAQAAECERLLRLWAPHLGTRRSSRAKEALDLLAEKEEARNRTCFCGKHFQAHSNQQFCCVQHGWLWNSEQRRLAAT